MFDQILGEDFVEFDSRTLGVGTIVANLNLRIDGDDAFVGCKFEVDQVLDDLLDAAILLALLIRVLDAQEVDAAAAVRDAVLDQRR